MRTEEGYSSSVEIFLKVGNAHLEVAQVMNDTLILRDDPGFDISGYAELVVVVDGEATKYQVILWKVTAGTREVAYS